MGVSFDVRWVCGKVSKNIKFNDPNSNEIAVKKK